MKLPSFVRLFVKNRLAFLAALVLVVIGAMAMVGPYLYAVDPFDMVGPPFQPPFGSYWLGTDVSGRDILAGLLHGASVSLSVGLVSTAVATLIGVTFGATAGYFGGWLDENLHALTIVLLDVGMSFLRV